MDLWTTHVCQALKEKTVTRELGARLRVLSQSSALLRQPAAVSAWCLQALSLILSSGRGIASTAFRPSGAYAAKPPLDRAPADTMSLCANATSEAQPAFGLSDPSSANPLTVHLIIAGSISVPVITHQRERPLPLISQACRHACLHALTKMNSSEVLSLPK